MSSGGSEHGMIIFAVSFISIFVLLVGLMPSVIFAQQGYENKEYLTIDYPSEDWSTGSLGSTIITSSDNASITYGEYVILEFEVPEGKVSGRIQVYWVPGVSKLQYNHDHGTTYFWIWNWTHWYPCGSFTKQYIEDHIPAGESVSSFFVSCTDLTFITQIKYDADLYSSFSEAWDNNDVQVLCGYAANTTTSDYASNAWELLGNILLFQGFELHPDTEINFALNALFASGPLWICIIITVAYFIDKLLPFF